MHQWNDGTYISHHGIYGMKWGERRYQNEDGTLTDAGKKRYAKVLSNERLQNRQRKRAKKILKKDYKLATAKASYQKSASYSFQKKAQKQLDKGNKLKAGDLFAKYIKNQEYSKINYARADIIYKKLSDIDSELIKAGRDFIVQKDYNFYPTPFGLLTSRNYKIVYKNKD